MSNAEYDPHQQEPAEVDALTEIIQRHHRSTMLSMKSQLRSALHMRDWTRASRVADRILEKVGYGRV